MNSWVTELKYLWLGWELHNGLIEHEPGDHDNGVVLYDSPRGNRLLNVIFRTKWIKRGYNPNYKIPTLLISAGTTKTNPAWDRDKAYPVISWPDLPFGPQYERQS